MLWGQSGITKLEGGEELVGAVDEELGGRCGGGCFDCGDGGGSHWGREEFRGNLVEVGVQLL